jgi:hypothetical protein
VILVTRDIGGAFWLGPRVLAFDIYVIDPLTTHGFRAIGVCDLLLSREVP